MTDAADAGLERMYRLVNGRNHLPDGAAKRDDASRAQGVESFGRALRLDDRIKVAAIGDVERQRSEAGNLDLDAAPGEVGRHVPDADGPDPVALRLIVNVDDARRDFDAQLARLARRNEAVLQAERHDADGAVAAHGEAAAGLDEQDAAVGVVAGRRREAIGRAHV